MRVCAHTHVCVCVCVYLGRFQSLSFFHSWPFSACDFCTLCGVGVTLGPVPWAHPSSFSEYNPWASSWLQVQRSILSLPTHLFIRPSEASQCTEVTWEEGPSCDTKACGTAVLTAEWKFILGGHGQKAELGAVLDSCNSQGTHGSVFRTGQGLFIQLAWTCLLKALCLLYCFIKLRLHKFWLRRSRALKAERSGVRGVSQHLWWVLWDNRRPWRDAHTLEAISRAVLELTRGGTIATLCPYYNCWFNIKAFHRNSLWKKATPSTLSHYRSLVPFDSWFQRSLSGQTLSIHPQSHFSEPSMAPRVLGQGNSHLFSAVMTSQVFKDISNIKVLATFLSQNNIQLTLHLSDSARPLKWLFPEQGISFQNDTAHQDNGAYSHHTYISEETTYGILPPNNNDLLHCIFSPPVIVHWNSCQVLLLKMGEKI